MAHLSVCRQKLIHVTRFILIYKILMLSSLGFDSKGSACFLEPAKKAQRPFTDFSETKRLFALFPPQLHSLHLPLPCSRLILSPSCWLAGKSNRFKDPMESLPFYMLNPACSYQYVFLKLSFFNSQPVKNNQQISYTMLYHTLFSHLGLKGMFKNDPPWLTWPHKRWLAVSVEGHLHDRNPDQPICIICTSNLALSCTI